MLAVITDKPAYADRTQAVIAAFLDRFNEHFANMPALLAGFELSAAPVLITLPRGDQALFDAVRRAGLPNRIIRWHDEAVATVCRDWVCSAPVRSADQLSALLEQA